MGLGCNVVGVMGARIIDSPRERLIAILTNALTPCNGRFPTLIVLMGMFIFGGTASPLLGALSLTGVMVLSICATFAVSKLLSKTVLKGIPSTFALELPPLRRPEILRTVVRSIFDRTLKALFRALAVAAPAGAAIFLLANTSLGGASLLSHLVRALDPAARLIGLDGATLSAFALGFPANEIVLPIAAMAYASGGALRDISNLVELRALLLSNGWTTVRAICALIFTLFHWPCSTTVLTIYRETKSALWTLVSVLIPTIVGALLCALVAGVFR